MLPPDRSHLATEQRNAASEQLHCLAVSELVSLFNQDNRAVLSALDHAAPALTQLLSAIETDFIAGGRLIYCGAGTSGRLAVLDASEAPPTFHVSPDRIIGIIAGGDGALRRSSEGMEDDPNGAAAELHALQLTPRDTVIGIAAGGTTPYALGAIRLGKASGTHTALMTCAHVAHQPEIDHLIYLPTGPEVLTGSTRLKAGTATKLALNTISTALMVRSGKVYKNLMVDVRATNEKLRDRAARIISIITGLERSASFTLLAAAHGSAKTAIVMHHRHCSQPEAERLLAEHHGRLDRLLDHKSH
jgi:N-acetylmuramic acid 6-phosphate etherase